MSASDASASGCGVLTAMWTPEEVRQAGRTRERDRFRDCRAVSARGHAIEAASLSIDDVSQEEDEDLADEAANTIVRGDTAGLRQLGVTIEFPEVATLGLAVSRWVPRFWGAWQHEQVLEARALLMSLWRVPLISHGRDAQQVLIVDSSGSLPLFWSVSEKEFRVAQPNTCFRLCPSQ